MKTRCLEEYTISKETTKRLPKGVLKFGHWHLYKWMGPARIPTLGNFMNALSRTNDKSFFSIAVYVFNGENGYGEFASKEWNSELSPFQAAISEDQWSLVYLRPFRESPNRKLLEEGLDDDQVTKLRRLVYGFDSVLFIGRAEPATFDITGVDY